jgi:hypothetical protein
VTREITSIRIRAAANRSEILGPSTFGEDVERQKQRSRHEQAECNARRSWLRLLSHGRQRRCHNGDELDVLDDDERLCTRDVDTPERAYEIAARASAAPGPGGVPLNMPIEVREVMSAPPVEV